MKSVHDTLGWIWWIGSASMGASIAADFATDTIGGHTLLTALIGLFQMLYALHLWAVARRIKSASTNQP